MKRNGLKSMKSVVIAVSLCAGLAVGGFGVAKSSCNDTLSITPFGAWFIDGAY